MIEGGLIILGICSSQGGKKPLVVTSKFSMLTFDTIYNGLVGSMYRCPGS